MSFDDFLFFSWTFFGYLVKSKQTLRFDGKINLLDFFLSKLFCYFFSHIKTTLQFDVENQLLKILWLLILTGLLLTWKQPFQFDVKLLSCWLGSQTRRLEKAFSGLKVAIRCLSLHLGIYSSKWVKSSSVHAVMGRRCWEICLCRSAQVLA